MKGSHLQQWHTTVIVHRFNISIDSEAPSLETLFLTRNQVRGVQLFRKEIKQQEGSTPDYNTGWYRNGFNYIGVVQFWRFLRTLLILLQIFRTILIPGQWHENHLLKHYASQQQAQVRSPRCIRRCYLIPFIFQRSRFLVVRRRWFLEFWTPEKSTRPPFFFPAVCMECRDSGKFLATPET